MHIKTGPSWYDEVLIGNNYVGDRIMGMERFVRPVADYWRAGQRASDPAFNPFGDTGGSENGGGRGGEARASLPAVSHGEEFEEDGDHEGVLVEGYKLLDRAVQKGISSSFLRTSTDNEKVSQQCHRFSFPVFFSLLLSSSVSKLP